MTLYVEVSFEQAGIIITIIGIRCRQRGKIKYVCADWSVCCMISYDLLIAYLVMGNAIAFIGLRRPGLIKHTDSQRCKRSG